MKQKNLAYLLAALMATTAIIYFVAAAEESAEGQEEEASEQATAGDVDGDNDGPQETVEQGKDAMATQVQTAFFAVTGTAYAAVSGWMLKDKGRTRAPYIIAIAGSISIIALYIASRSADLPIVGLQDDVGTIDIASKVLQVAIVALAAWLVSSNKALKPVPSRQNTR